MSRSAFLPPAGRFAGIVNALFGAIDMRRNAGFLAPAVTNLLLSRLAQLRGRILRLAERLAAGKGPGVPRAPRICPPGPDTAAPRATPRRPAQRLAGRAGWMLRLVPEAAAYGSQLQFLLHDPDMAAMIEAAPQMKRLLFPLCRSLGVEMPSGLRPPARKPRSLAPRTPKPRPPRPPASVAARIGPDRIGVAWPGLRRPWRQHGLPMLAPSQKPPDPSGSPAPA